LSAAVAQQIITSMRIIMGLDGTDEGMMHSHITSHHITSICRCYFPFSEPLKLL